MGDMPMKRSEINRALRGMEAMLEQHRFQNT